MRSSSARRPGDDGQAPPPAPRVPWPACLTASARPIGRFWARAASLLGRVPSRRARPVRGGRGAARAAPRAGGVPTASGPGLDPLSVLGGEGGRELAGPAELPTRLVLLAQVQGLEWERGAALGFWRRPAGSPGPSGGARAGLLPRGAS